MKRLDEDKTSFVEFMRSIKFNTRKEKDRSHEVSNHFAHLNPQARPAGSDITEDFSSVRSGN